MEKRKNDELAALGFLLQNGIVCASFLRNNVIIFQTLGDRTACLLGTNHTSHQYVILASPLFVKFQ